MRIGEPCRRVFEEDGLAAYILLLRNHADPTRAPVDVDINFNVSYNRSVPMWA